MICVKDITYTTVLEVIGENGKANFVSEIHRVKEACRRPDLRLLWFILSKKWPIVTLPNTHMPSQTA